MKLTKLVRSTNLELKSNANKNYNRVLMRALGFALRRTKDQRYNRLQGLLRGRQWRLFYDEACAVHPTMYTDADSYFIGAQIKALVKKYPWDSKLLGFDPEGAAIAAVLKAEHRCRRMNQWFVAKRRVFYANEDFFERARKFIAYVLGPCDTAQLLNQCDWGPGASLGVHGSATHIGRKFDATEWTCTPGALLYLPTAVRLNPHLFPFEYRAYPRTEEGAERMGPDNVWERLPKVERENRIYCIGQISSDVRLKVVSSNKNEFANKSADVKRSIRTEPLVNGMMQKSVDRHLRHRLRRVGIDLSDQRRNAYYALFGSEDWRTGNGFCTIDLSSASDSISIELVRELLPPEWFVFLNNLRSPSGDFGAYGNIRYQGFVTMGNGFCFPLETLIFAAICHASGAGSVRKDFLVYGDDIVVRQQHFNEVIKNLKLCGFLPNKSKTFGEGPFRESCGCDFWEGQDVRPFTLDYALDSVQSVFKFLNLCRRNAKTSAFFEEIWFDVLNLLPAKLQLMRPYKTEQHDTAINPWVEPPQYASSTWHWDRWYSTWSWVEIGSQPVEDESDFSAEATAVSILRGNTDKFFYRRKTRTRVRRTPDLRAYGRVRSQTR